MRIPKPYLGKYYLRVPVSRDVQLKVVVESVARVMRNLTWESGYVVAGDNENHCVYIEFPDNQNAPKTLEVLDSYFRLLDQ